MIMCRQFEANHTMVGAGQDMSKSMVMLNRKITWHDNGIMYEPDPRHCERVVEALELKQANKVGTPAVKESEHDGEMHDECSWESLQAPHRTRDQSASGKPLEPSKASR